MTSTRWLQVTFLTLATIPWVVMGVNAVSLKKSPGWNPQHPLAYQLHYQDSR